MAGYPSVEDRVIAALERIADTLDAIRALLLQSLPAPVEAPVDEPPQEEPVP